MASTSEYWVGDVIGEGSFGVVVYGRYKQCGTSQQNDQLHVAIKCIDKNSLHRQPSIAMAVIQEQRLLKRLKQQQHTPSIDVTKQNDDTTSGAGSATTTTNSSKKIKHNRNFIVDLYASFHDAECVYLVLECCSGGTLQDVLDHFKSMKETSSKTNHQTVTLAIDDDNDAPVSSTTRKYLLEATQYYGKQLILGISFVHASSIIHCDIKPSNILLTNCGCIKISDFGCSIDLLNNNASIQTKAVVNDPNSSSPSLVPTKSSGWVMLPRGTAAYAAPELNRMSQSPEPPRQQNTDNADIFVAPTFAVDLWSLGCILYACLLVESHQQSPFDKGSEAMSIKGQKEYCDIKETDARYTSLFGKGLLDEDNTDKESVLLPAFKDMIAALLSPKAEERIKFANSERQTKSENIELTSSLHQQNESSSVINVAGNPYVTYPNLQRNIVWDTDEATHTQPQPVRTDFLPPIPSWWIKNSAALTPPKSTAVSGHESSDDSTTNVLMDGAIGWSAFLV